MRPERPKKPINYHEHDTAPDYPDESSVASANECTGLMYRVPMDDGELDSYEELYNMEIPRGDRKVGDSIQASLHRSHTAEQTGKAVEKVTGSYAPDEGIK